MAPVPFALCANTALAATSSFGLLPLAVVLFTVAALRIGALAFQTEPPHLRALFGAVATLSATVLYVRILGAAGALTRGALIVPLAAATIALLVVKRENRVGLRLASVVGSSTAPVAVVGAITLAVAGLAAYLLPIWQWDSLGYHLPYVNFALQRGTLADVPVDVPYISTYPHDIELYFAAFRAMLPDDRLVDMAQIPFGLLGVAAIACLARQLGGRSDHAVAAGVLWLGLPAAFLQLPTNYIDVAAAALLLSAAAFTMAPPSARTILGAGLSLGLFLGSKPNAPLATAVMFALLAVRAFRTQQRKALAGALGLVVLLGGEAYLTNLVCHGNPIWPIELHLGPVALPGYIPVSTLINSGAGAPRLHGPLLLRMLISWVSLDAPPAFDMRYGGLGLVFVAALPVAVALAVRRRAWPLALIALATAVGPDPAVPRYVMAFPGLVLAVASVALSRVPARWCTAIFAAAAMATAFGLYRAYPGLSGEGPPLSAYLSMSPEKRLSAVGANGSPARFFDATGRLRPGDTTAFDASLDLPYLAWPPDLSKPVLRIPDDVDEATARRIVGDPKVRLFIVDRDSKVTTAIRASSDSFVELFTCKSTPCIVFLKS